MGRHIKEERTNRHEEIFDVRGGVKHPQTAEHYEKDSSLTNDESQLADFLHSAGVFDELSKRHGENYKLLLI